MPDEEEAKKAIEALHQSEFKQRTMNVAEAQAKESKPRSFGGNGGYNKGGGGQHQLT